jgi:hypothetical protein
MIDPTPRLATAMRSATPPAAPALPASAEPAKPPSPPAISPRLRIDPALHIVVMEFREAGGEVVHSLPTPRELAAYREGAATGAPGPGLDVKR